MLPWTAVNKSNQGTAAAGKGKSPDWKGAWPGRYKAGQAPEQSVWSWRPKGKELFCMMAVAG